MEPSNNIGKQTYKINDFISEKAGETAFSNAEKVKYARKFYSESEKIVKVRASFTDKVQFFFKKSSMKISNPTKDYWLEVGE